MIQAVMLICSAGNGNALHHWGTASDAEAITGSLNLPRWMHDPGVVVFSASGSAPERGFCLL